MIVFFNVIIDYDITKKELVQFKKKNELLTKYVSHAACMRCFFLVHFFTWVTPGPPFPIFPLIFSLLYVRNFSLIYYIIIFDKIVEFRSPKTVDSYSLSSLIGPYLSYLNILLIVAVSQYSGYRSILSQFTLKYCGISLCRLANFCTCSVYFAQSMWVQITNTNHLFIPFFLSDYQKFFWVCRFKHLYNQ